MIPPSSDFPLSAAMGSQRESQRGRALIAQSLAIAAAVLGLLWGPAMWIVALALRPPELNSNGYSYTEVVRLQQDSELHMWVIQIASFLAILALMVFAIVVERKALRFVGSERAVARLGKWGGICLVISLLSLLSIVIVETSLNVLLPVINYSYIYTIGQFIVIGLIATTAMGTIGSFVLNGVTARNTAWARIKLVVSTLMLLLWFLFVAFVAQFIVAFHMHLVF